MKTAFFFVFSCFAFAAESAPAPLKPAVPEPAPLTALAIVRAQRDANTQLAQDIHAQLQLAQQRIAALERELAALKAASAAPKAESAETPAPSPAAK